MSTDNNPLVTERDIQAYIDGHIDPGTERAGAVEAYLAAIPEARARARAYRAQNEAIRARFQYVLAEPVPERLRPETLRSKDNGAAGNHRSAPVRIAAGLVVACSAAFLGWLAAQPDEAAIEGFADRVSTHLAQPGEVESVASPPVLESVSALGGAPDFTTEGLQLVGARQVDNGDMYESRYQDRAGRELRLFVAPDPQRHNDLLSRTEAGGYEVVYWQQGPLMYALTGDYDRRRLDDFARTAIDRGGRGTEAGRLANSERESKPLLSSGGDEVTAAQRTGVSQTSSATNEGLDPGQTALDAPIQQLQSGIDNGTEPISNFQ